MWHGNYNYWDDGLRDKQNFPAAKISNKWAYEQMQSHNKDDLNRCVSWLEKSPEAANITRKLESLMDKANTMNHWEKSK